MDCDLIVVAEYTKKEDYIDKTIISVNHHNFNKKYILLDGMPKGKLKTHHEKYKRYKKNLRKIYKDFQVIEYDEYNQYRELLKKFINHNKKGLAKNCLIIKYNIVLDNFDLDKILQLKADYKDSFLKILYFRENIKRTPYWFNIIEEEQELFKTHKFSENVYLITKEDLEYLLSATTDNYYDEMLKDKSWETITEKEQLEYWKKWGSYEHKTIYHKLLCVPY